MLALSLVDAAASIDQADSLDAASSAYFTARAAFYAVVDDGTVADADRFAWGVVLDVFDEALDRFATPVEPLVVFG